LKGRDLADHSPEKKRKKKEGKTPYRMDGGTEGGRKSRAIARWQKRGKVRFYQ